MTILLFRLTFLTQGNLVLIITNRERDHTLLIGNLEILNIPNICIFKKLRKRRNNRTLHQIRLTLRSLARLFSTLHTSCVIHAIGLRLSSQFLYCWINNIALITEVTFNAFFNRETFFTPLYKNFIRNINRPLATFRSNESMLQFKLLKSTLGAPYAGSTPAQ